MRSIKKRLEDLEDSLTPPPRLFPDDQNGRVHRDAPICQKWNGAARFFWRQLTARTAEEKASVEAEIQRRGHCSCDTCLEYREYEAQIPPNPELLALIRSRAGLGSGTVEARVSQ